MQLNVLSRPFPGYRTRSGQYYNCTIEQWLESGLARKYRKKVQLILTSPPFPLNRKKSYGNRNGESYLAWLRALAPKLAELLTPDGSLVVEIGNAWNPGEPTMSTLPLEALLAIKQAAGLHLCQEFVCHNPARLPSPVGYVNVERIRVKDSWTRLWWLAPSSRPKADSRRVLLPYSQAMKDLLKSKKYNSGRRPSQHKIGEKSFLTDNGGSIPPSAFTESLLDHFGSFLCSANTRSSGDPYLAWCREHQITPHPARMQAALAAFFISFLTDPDDLVMDPFAGSNTTGACAHDLGRRWISVEAEAHNLEPSAARIQASEPDNVATTARPNGRDASQ